MSAPDFEDLLLRTSRTFALSIPLLEGPVRNQVTLSYLLFRIADTFEDAASWSRERRVEALHCLRGWLEEMPDAVTQQAAVAGWLEEPLPSDHQGYLDLLAATPEVLAAVETIEPVAHAAICHHTQRTCAGMAGFVERAKDDGSMELRNLDDLKSYCYVVAGIVGEMLTDLFLAAAPGIRGSEAGLRARAATFGEALQLVNILKDSAADRAEGRTFLPPGVSRSEVFSLARADLGVATEYVLLLQNSGAPRGDVAFTALPVRLAWAALREVEAKGAGAKVSRAQVAEIAMSLQADLDSGRPAVS